MPDYTASAVLHSGYNQKINGTLMIANAYGMADNASANYSDLLDFGTTPDGLDKGVFSLAEFRLKHKGVWMSLAAWANTREDEPPPI